MNRAARIAASLVLLAALPAVAHTGLGAHSHGFEAGFVHPFMGLDHLLAMVAVGLWASRAKGAAMAWAPLAFMAGMLAGGMAGIANLALPFAEGGVVGSAIAICVLVVIGLSPNSKPALAAIAIFGAFHGVAHGLEMPEGSAAVTYSASFLLATLLLHGLGVLVGCVIRRKPLESGQRL